MHYIFVGAYFYIQGHARRDSPFGISASGPTAMGLAGGGGAEAVRCGLVTVL